MNLGKFAVDAIKAWNPLSPEGYARRDRNKAFRKARREAKREQKVAEASTVILPSGETIQREEPLIALRTSTKAGGTATVGTIVLGLVGVFFPTALDNLTPEQALWIGGAISAAVGWITARFVKSPAKPGAL